MSYEEEQLEKTKSATVGYFFELTNDAPKNLESFRLALRRIIELEAWKARYEDMYREVIRFDSFEEFLTTRPRRGAGTTLEEVRQLIKDDPELMLLVDEVCERGAGGKNNPAGCKGKQGGINVDTVHSDSEPKMPRPSGNSRQRTARRLRQAAEAGDESAAQVLEEFKRGMSARACRLRMGWEKELSAYEQIQRLVRKLSAGDRDRLITWIAEEFND